MKQRLALLLAAVAALALVSQASGDDKPAPAASNAAAHKFDHEIHWKNAKVEREACGSCHAAKADGQPAAPGADGHKPCMTSGCHLERNTKQGGFLDKDPKLCLGCHASSDNFKRNPAVKVFKERPRPEFYVEFDHKAHMDRKGPDGVAGNRCTNCHWLDKTSFAAVLRPGHAQCTACHSQEKAATTMSDCGACHREGDRAKVFFSAKRKEAKIDKSKFKHEHVGHRFLDKQTMTKPLECAHCHKRVENYSDLAKLKQAPIIDNDTMRGSCAKSGCHPDVDEAGKCGRCHEPGIEGAGGTFMHIKLD